MISGCGIHHQVTHHAFDGSDVIKNKAHGNFTEGKPHQGFRIRIAQTLIDNVDQDGRVPGIDGDCIAAPDSNIPSQVGVIGRYRHDTDCLQIVIGSKIRSEGFCTKRRKAA